MMFYCTSVPKSGMFSSHPTGFIFFALMEEASTLGRPLKNNYASGTFHETTAANTPKQNGLGERINGTIATHALAMLIDFGLPKSFWGYALETAAYLHCRSPAAGLKGRTPYEKLFNCKVDPSMFRPFGCVAYALVPKEHRSGKFDSKAHKSIMIGYTPYKKAYRLMDLGTQKIFHSP